MTDKRTYPAGVPSWIDTEQPDVDAARQFYGKLFGWTFTDAMPPDAPGSYFIAALDGADVAAIGPADDTDGAAGWNMYVAVDDADSVAASVRNAGGAVDIDPVDAGPGGRLAGCSDPGGASFRLWQARNRPGVQTSNVPGAWNFNELHTSDVAAATAFYAAVFGWEFTDSGFATMIRMPGYGEFLASAWDPEIFERQASAPDGFADAVGWIAESKGPESTFWATTFTVGDRDGSTELAETLGATVLESSDTEWTKVAHIRDPQGAELTLSQFTPPEGW